MSLLLDALKKAADDKKKSVDDSTDDSSTDESSVQDNKHVQDDDSLELDLQDDNDFPQVEDQPVVSQNQQATPATDNHTETATVSESTDELEPDTSQDKRHQDADSQTEHDNEHIEQAAEMELTGIQTTDSEATGIPDESQSEPQQKESLTPSTITESADTDAAASTVTQTTDQFSAAESTHAINPVNQAERPRKSAENEAALSALINKSNQYQQRAQKKRTILLVTLILLLISGSALFFYLKTEMASQELYIAQNNNSPVLRETPPLSKPSEPTTGNKTAVINTDDNTLDPDPIEHTKLAAQNQASDKTVAIPLSTQTVSPKQTVVANKATNRSPDRRIHIQQSSREDPIEPLIMDAYNAFQQGRYEQAETLYQQVLAQEPRNRDAMLGLAATALKQQRYEVARQKYLALLQLNPRDSLAMAGLSSVNQGSLQHSSDTALSESQLKFMLKEQPDAPHLYFALGSLHASKGQWPQAQSAYFSAWSADSNNADYTFNLAVSLDHINQPQQALQYYQLCLKLMRNSSANFSAAQVKQRINSLQEAMR